MPLTTTARRAAAVALLAVLGLAGLGAAPAAAGTAWTVRTAANDFGADRRNYGYTLDPGGSLTDGLVIANPGTAPLRLSVYAADAFTTEDGRLDLLAQGARSAAVGAWVRPSRPDVTVPAGGSVEVPFTLTLPPGAAPGEYLGGVVTAPAGSGERRGIRIRLRVGGELRPRLSVEDPRVGYAGGGDATVTYTIRNTGNAVLAARQAVSVSGVRAGRIGDSPRLLPGESWKVSVPVHGVTPVLRLTGTIEVVPLLTDASNSIAPLAAVRATASAWGVSWGWALPAIAAGCGLVAAFVALRRRRASR
ncbi:COG1470 family protein [Nonomuraea gerenzanensis]|uniref:DUF916 domain-containing protein n=1 Tax=Nonomuraea gerenzanensis TaxID=93944 RepID=A0A1M4DYQ4_9ACTN|nr:hypothetical protein [Nonomuraea gerenzanensis]UBU14019.1 hypothetical protein LCN96_03005 [Nonomuraea gerenzanensis]SBO91705.1 hypothetical protein BN4615_P1219 [Nonomuraea gerenzanensis]